MDYLHIYAQDHEHGTAVIVGDLMALHRLSAAVGEIIRKCGGIEGSGIQSARCDHVMVNDDEGYHVIVVRLPTDDLRHWNALPVPYTDEHAAEKDERKWGALVKLVQEAEA